MNAATSLQFVDTNILIYAHDRSAEVKHRLALALVRDLWASRVGCVSIQVLQEFYVNITRNVAHPLSLETAAHIVADLAAWEVHRPSVDDALNAIRVQERHQISFWDAMIIVSAQQLGCATLWSEDLGTGQVFDMVTVRSPFTPSSGM